MDFDVINGSSVAGVSEEARVERSDFHPTTSSAPSELFNELNNFHCSYERVADILKSVNLLELPYCDDKDEYNTPLHIAVSNPSCSKDIIQLLLNHGASVRAVNSRSQTPLHVILQNDVINYEVLNILLARSSLKKRDNVGNTPLHVVLANKNCDLQVVELLIRKGASLKIFNSTCLRPLEVYLLNPTCKLEIVKFLLDNGATADDPYAFCPPLLTHLKNQNCRVEIVRELIEHGANTQQIDLIKEYTALHFVVQNPNSIEVLSELLERGNIDINAGEAINNTPLHLAIMVEEADVRVISLLLKHGASVHSQNSMGEYPLSCAVAKFIPNMKVVKLLLEAGSPIWEVDEEQISPLQVVLQKYMAEPDHYRACIELLLKYAVKKHIIEKDETELSICREYLLSYLLPDVDYRDCSHLSSFIAQCCGELMLMKENSVKKNFSLLDILRCPTQRISRDLTIEVLDTLCFNNYSIYKDNIGESLDQLHLINILCESGFYCKKDDQIQNELPAEKITLVEDCVFIVVKNLDIVELFNLTLAYYKPTNCSFINKCKSTKKHNDRVLET